MERIAENPDLDLLRRANASLDRFFERFCDAAVLGTPDEVDALQQIERTLQAVGTLLDGRLQSSKEYAVQQELVRYRKNLLELQRELAGMQQSAEGCRARLYSRQKHLHAARAWCTASRATS